MSGWRKGPYHVTQSGRKALIRRAHREAPALPDPDPLPTPADGTPGGPAVDAQAMSDTRFGSSTTWYSQNTRKWGKFATGDVYMVVPSGSETIIAIDPTWTGNRHGTMKNMAAFQNDFGFHDPEWYGSSETNFDIPGSTYEYWYWSSALRAAPPITVTAWDVLHTERSYVDGDPAGKWVKHRMVSLNYLGRPGVETIKPLFIVPEEPPPNALPPSMWNAGNRLLKNGGSSYYTLEDIQARLALLPSLTRTVDAPSPAEMEATAQRLFIPALGGRSGGVRNYEGNITRFFNGRRQVHRGDAYGGFQSSWISLMSTWLCLDWTIQEKLPVAMVLCRQAIDFYDSPGRFTDSWIGTAGGGLSHGDVGATILGGFILGHSPMQNAYRDLDTVTAARASKYHAQCIYCPNDATEINYLSDTNFTGGKLRAIRDPVTKKIIVGTPTWVERSYSADRNPYHINRTDYQITNTANRWAGQALALNLAGLTDSLGNDAFFDYTDWYMAESDDPAWGLNDEEKRSDTGWIESVWDTHRIASGTRPHYNAPPHVFR